MDIDLKKKIVDKCNNYGITEIGFVKAREYHEMEKVMHQKFVKGYNSEFEYDYDESRISPLTYMKDCKTIISIAFPYFRGKILNNGFSMYTQSKDYHSIVKKFLDDISKDIISRGFKAKGFVDNNNLPEKHIASIAGIGKIGKNSLLYNKKYGSYFFIGEILTDYKFEVDKDECKISSPCGNCEKCIKSCPGKAISDEHNFLDSSKCLSYITQKKTLTLDELELIDDLVWGCDVCQKVCPLNSEIEISPLSDFDELEYMDSVTLEEVATMTNEEFKKKYKEQSCGFRGKNILIRNALNALHKRLGKNTFEQKFHGKDYKSKVVSDFFNGLLKE